MSKYAKKKGGVSFEELKSILEKQEVTNNWTAPAALPAEEIEEKQAKVVSSIELDLSFAPDVSSIIAQKRAELDKSRAHNRAMEHHTREMMEAAKTLVEKYVVYQLGKEKVAKEIDEVFSDATQDERQYKQSARQEAMDEVRRQVNKYYFERIAEIAKAAKSADDYGDTFGASHLSTTLLKDGLDELKRRGLAPTGITDTDLPVLLENVSVTTLLSAAKLQK